MDPVRHNHSDDTSELLSAYVDGAADVAERKRAEASIERCPACARELGELRALKSMLRELPALQPARSFTLDPATAPRPRWLLFPTLRFATLLSAVLLFVVLGVDALGGAGGSTSGGASAPMAVEAGAASAAARTDERSASQAEAAQPQFDIMAASEAAEASVEAAAASMAPNTPAESYAEASAEASEESESQAPESAASAAGAAAPDTAGAQTETDGGADSAQASTAASNLAPEAAASEVPAAALAPQGGSGYDAPPAEQRLDNDRDAEPLESAGTSSPDTVTAAAEPDAASSFDSLLIAEVLLALVAAALGLGAFWAWRTGR